MHNKIKDLLPSMVVDCCEVISNGKSEEKKLEREIVIIRKRIHVRIEHVQPSRCTEDFKLRKKKNDKLKAEAKVMGEVISTKRRREGPKPGFMVEGATLETITPIPYDVVNDLKGGY
ncbi:hypothetical protein CsSME_00012745 [Camellia sinensis var. sinensis]